MKKVKLKVRINKGTRGVPLKKMASITDEIGKFLDLFCKDLSINIPADGWLATDFKDGSCLYTVESLKEIEVEKERDFNRIFTDLAKHRKLNGRVSKPTYYQYSRIVESITPDESVEFGLLDGEREPGDWFELTKEQSEEIESIVQNIIEEKGAIQGLFHAWFLKSDTPHFTIRELSTENLINCYYDSKDYDLIHSLTEKPDGVVHVSGLITWDTLTKKITKLKAEKFEVALEFTDQDFEDFFGCAPNITGKVSTVEYLKSIRADGE